jgi:hypothetical protein
MTPTSQSHHHSSKECYLWNYTHWLTRNNLLLIFAYLQLYRHGSKHCEKELKELKAISPDDRYETKHHYKLNDELFVGSLKDIEADLVILKATMDHPRVKKEPLPTRLEKIQEFLIKKGEILKLFSPFEGFYTKEGLVSEGFYPLKTQEDLFKLCFQSEKKTLDKYTLFLCDLLFLFPYKKASNILDFDTKNALKEAWQKFSLAPERDPYQDHDINHIPFNDTCFRKETALQRVQKEEEQVSFGVCMSYLRLLFTLSPYFKDDSDSYTKTIQTPSFASEETTFFDFRKSNRNHLTPYDLSYLGSTKAWSQWWQGLFETPLQEAFQYDMLQMKTKKIPEKKKAPVDSKMPLTPLFKASWHEKLYWSDTYTRPHQLTALKQRVLSSLPQKGKNLFLGVTTFFDLVVPQGAKAENIWGRFTEIEFVTELLLLGQWKEMLEKETSLELVEAFEFYREELKKKFNDKQYQPSFLSTWHFLLNEIQIFQNILESPSMVLDLLKGLTTADTPSALGQYVEMGIYGNHSERTLLSYIHYKEQFIWLFNRDYGSFKFDLSALEMQFLLKLPTFKKDQDLFDFLFEDQQKPDPHYENVYKFIKILLSHVINHHFFLLNKKAWDVVFISKKYQRKENPPFSLLINEEPEAESFRAYDKKSGKIVNGHLSEIEHEADDLANGILKIALHKLSEERLALFSPCFSLIQKGHKELFPKD